MLIATHDGSFHADETLACAIIAYVHDYSEVIRSRDPRELEKADIVIDVSGLNDHKHYDHHSPLFKESRPNGINYATAGLMWRKFGHEYLEKVISNHFNHISKSEFTEALYTAAFERIDREIMCLVDLNDNGQLNSYLEQKLEPLTAEKQAILDEVNEFYRFTPDIPYIVAMQNLPNVTEEEQNKQFSSTVLFLKNVLLNASINAINTELGIAKVLDLYDGGELLIMHEKLPWTQAVLSNFDKFGPCKLAIYPDRKRGWRIQSLPASKSARFKNKLTAPVEWRGLDDEELDKVSGLDGTIFVHRAGFTGGASEFETILAMAKLWLENGVVE